MASRPHNSASYYLRADEAARLAAESHLENVRRNLLGAERAWRVMAEQAAKSEVATELRHLAIANKGE